MKYTKHLKAHFVNVVVVIAIVLSLAWILILPKYLELKHGRSVMAAVDTSPQGAAKEATPASTSSPSPSPEVLTGFCLNAPILMYHHIQPAQSAKDKGQTALSVDNGTFDSQMAYLNQAGYTSISSIQLVQALSSKSKLPGKSVLITIDDGYADAYNFALALLQKYHIHSDWLIPTGLLNNPDYMNWDQLKAAISSGLVSIVNHTHSHANLAAADAGKISFEILTAKKQLADIGQNPNIFGFPYGAINNNVIKFLQGNGFIAALSTIPGQTQCDSFLMSLHRTRIGGSSLRAYGL